jgi:hypothetical protein
MIENQFYALFSGNERSHGRWSPKTGQMRTEKEPLSPEAFKMHLSGKEGVGAVPLRDDERLTFAAIDIDNHGDDKDIDLLAMAKTISGFSLPLVACRSKSGGIHCYLFTTEPVLAAPVRKLLAIWAKKIGYPSAEIFPKQDRLLGHGEDRQLGNWINLPYFGGDDTVRYAMLDNGNKLSAKEFIAYAKSRAVAPSVIESALNVTHPNAPPCVAKMLNEGIGSGDRNKALYNITVYLRRAFPESYFDNAIDINGTIFSAPLPHTEAKRTIKSASRRDYSYKCGEEPCKSRCNRAECIKREFGISRDEYNDLEASEHVPIITDIVRYDTEPVRWSMKVSGREVTSIPTEYLYDFNLLRKMLSEQLNPPMFLPSISRKKWETMIMPIMATAKVVDVPKESTPSGIMVSRLHDFLSKADSRGNQDYDEQREKERLTRGLPCVLQKDGKRYGVFRMADFVKYLKSTKSEDMRGAQLYFALRSMLDIDHRRIRVKDKLLMVWMVDLGGRVDPIAPDMTPEY